MRSFLLALATQLSNPKAVVVIGSIFAALLPAHVPVWMYVAIPPIIMTTETSWYTIVAVVVSAERPRAVYARWKVWIDRLAGTVLGALGLRLIADVGTST
jgi:threonine/homoserine/homoserine lactone efflux protein